MLALNHNNQEVREQLSYLHRRFRIIDITAIAAPVVDWFHKRAVRKRLGKINASLLRAIFSVEHKVSSPDRRMLDGARFILKSILDIREETPERLFKDNRIAELFEENAKLAYLLEKKVRVSLNNRKKVRDTSFSEAVLNLSKRNISKTLHDPKSA